MNNVNLIGRLTREPELKQSSNGTAYCKFTLAVNRPFDRDKKADFINCVAWKATAENLALYMRKGSQIGVVGSIQTGSYQNKDGNKVYTTEVMANQVMFLESKKQQDSGGYNDYRPAEKTVEDFMPKQEEKKQEYDIVNDDLPF